MAKQIGPFKITGCYDNICFYKMNGQYYARAKSSLDGKRVKKDPAFRETRWHSNLLARSSKIAAAVYRGLPKEKGLFRKLTGQAMRLLKEGKTTEEVFLLLQGPVIKVSRSRDEGEPVNDKKIISYPFAETVLVKIFEYPLAVIKAEEFQHFEAMPP